jgi:hypothetical protein
MHRQIDLCDHPVTPSPGKRCGTTGHLGAIRFTSADLSRRDGHAGPGGRQAGAAVIDGDRQILDAGRTNGAGQAISWAASAVGEGDAVPFADAPLVVRDAPGQRVCQTPAGQRCGRWSAPLRRMPIRPRLAGVRLLRLAGLSGWR